MGERASCKTQVYETGEMITDIGIGKEFLSKTPKAQESKANVDKHESKKLLHSKENKRKQYLEHKKVFKTCTCHES